jgi:hypothetical protein
MTPEERQKKFEQCYGRYAIIGVLLDGKTFDACICVDEISFEKEKLKFGEPIRIFKLVEIHKR